jgi:hypothetical protein
MPGGDRSGPAGTGPMTGRAAGYCAGNPVPGYMNAGAGGMGMAWRRGWRGAYGRGYQYPYASPTAYGSAVPGNYDPVQGQQQELSVLRSQADYFQKALKDIQNRISQLEGQKDE